MKPPIAWMATITVCLIAVGETAALVAMVLQR